MSHECFIEFTEGGGDNIRVRVRAAPTNSDERVNRGPPPLAQADFDMLRRGNPAPSELNRVTADLSQWFFGNDLPFKFILGLNDPEDRAWRLVFEVDQQMDPNLKGTLDELPLELLTLQNVNEALLFNNRVRSVVHKLAKQGHPPNEAANTWPMRVLIVRSSPHGMGPVPPAIPIRDAILAARPDLRDRGLLHFDVLSHEPNADGPPSKAQLQRHLEMRPDVMVFLGHGNLDAVDPTRPQHQLVLEKGPGEPDARQADFLESRDLSIWLHNDPVRAVLLVGCMTSANLPQDQQDAWAEQMPEWLRGSQGVAQALINGFSAVEFALGMRFQIDGGDGVNFIKHFFGALLGPPPGGNGNGSETVGDLEAAVRKARVLMKTVGSTTEAAWAAPMVFRAPGNDVVFPHLATLPSRVIKEIFQKSRESFWPIMALSSPDARDPMRDALKGLEDEIMADLGPATGLILPDLHEVGTVGPQDVEVAVRLRGPLSVEELEGKLTTQSGAVQLTGGSPAPEVEAAGFQVLFTAPSANEIDFMIRHPGGPTALPEGALFKVQMQVHAEPKQFYALGVTSVKTDPVSSFCPGDNAIIGPEA